MFSPCRQFLNVFKTNNLHSKDFIFKWIFWDSEETLVAKVYGVLQSSCPDAIYLWNGIPLPVFQMRFLNIFLEFILENIIPHLEWAGNRAERMQEAFLYAQIIILQRPAEAPSITGFVKAPRRRKHWGQLLAQGRKAVDCLHTNVSGAITLVEREL